ncbi:MAG: hypothetical protein QN119_13170 [Armatimonadota bacterium]|nr:hypothetical protein [Armatimonadota bacterium]
MAAPDPTQALFDLWKQAIEEGTRTWLRAVTQAGQAAAGTAAAADLAQLWRPLLGQGMEIWERAARQGALTPEFMEQWRALMTRSVELWAQALERVMGTDAFAQALGRHLDQWLTLQAPLRKGLEQYNDAALKALGLPSRSQVVRLAEQVTALEERLEAVEDRLGELRGLVADVLRAVRARGPGEPGGAGGAA